MKRHKIAPDVREQIINRVKEGVVSVQQAAKEHGVHETTVCGWLGIEYRLRSSYRSRYDTIDFAAWLELYRQRLGAL